jgi:hypothetical protein
MEKNGNIFPKLRKKTKVSIFFPFLINRVLEFLARAIKQEEIKRIQIG